MSHEEIAIALGVPRSTLEKHFEYELSVGAYRKRLEAIDAMHVAARAGNVAAQKAYLALTPRAAVTPLPKPEAAPKGDGKKATAQAASVAAHVGTDWETLLTPPATQQ